jgi:hypothetical protein
MLIKTSARNICRIALIYFCSSAGLHAEDCKPLRLIASVEMIPGEYAPYVPVTLNGRQKYMILDTGGAYSIVSPDTVRELGLSAFRREFSESDIAGKTTDMFAVVNDFSMAQLVSHNARFLISPHKLSEKAAGTIAPNFLEQFDVELDFGAHKVNFFSQDHCEGKVIYWPAAFAAVVPMRVTGLGHIYLRATLNGHEFKAVLDTGFTSSMLNMTDAQDVFGLTPQSPGVEPGDELNGDPTLKNYFYRFKTLTLEGMTVSEPRIQLLPDLMKARMDRSSHMEARLDTFDNSEARGLPALVIGYSILKHLHIYIAYKEQKLYITPATPPTTAPDATAPATPGTTATSH